MRLSKVAFTAVSEVVADAKLKEINKKWNKSKDLKKNLSKEQWKKIQERRVELKRREQNQV